MDTSKSILSYMTTKTCEYFKSALTSLINRDLFPHGQWSQSHISTSSVWTFSSEICDWTVEQVLADDKRLLFVLASEHYGEYTHCIGLRNYDVGTKVKSGPRDLRLNFTTASNLPTENDRFHLLTIVQETDDDKTLNFMARTLIKIKKSALVKKFISTNGYRSVLERVLTSACKGVKPIIETFNATTDIYTVSIRECYIDCHRLSLASQFMNDTSIRDTRMLSCMGYEMSKCTTFTVGLYIGPDTYYSITEQQKIFNMPINHIFGEYTLTDRYLQLKEYCRLNKHIITDPTPVGEIPYEYWAQYHPQRWILYIDVTNLQVLDNFYRLYPPEMSSHIQKVFPLSMCTPTFNLLLYDACSPSTSDVSHDTECVGQNLSLIIDTKVDTESTSDLLQTGECASIDQILPPIPDVKLDTESPSPNLVSSPISESQFTFPTFHDYDLSSPVFHDHLSISASDEPSSPVFHDQPVSPVHPSQSLPSDTHSSPCDAQPSLTCESRAFTLLSHKSHGLFESTQIHDSRLKQFYIAQINIPTINTRLVAIDNVEQKIIQIVPVFVQIVHEESCNENIVHITEDTPIMPDTPLQNIYKISKQITDKLGFSTIVTTRLLGVLTTARLSKDIDSSSLDFQKSLIHECRTKLMAHSRDVKLLSSDRNIVVARLKCLLLPDLTKLGITLT
jgi:hypothetical protein